MLQAHIVGSGVSREHERDHDAEHQRNDGSRHSRTTHGGVDPVLEGRQHQDQHAQQSAGADAGQAALPVDTLPEAAQQHSHSHAGQEGAHDGGDVADNVVDEQGDEEGSAQGADQSDTAVLGVIFFFEGKEVSPMPSGDAHRSLARALDILELCSLNGSGYTLTQLSQQLGIAKGSISPLLHTLRDRGYLTLDDQDHHYRIGRMAFRIGNTYLDEASALREIYRLMHDIVSVCHETCHLGSLKNGDVYYLKKVESPLYSHTVTVEGRSLPAYATGVGKALLADYQLPQLKALYYDGLYPLTEHTITDFRLLADQLAEIRASGFAYECEESTRGIRCIGVPLRKSGKVVAALSVAFPLERYSDAAAASARQALDEARRQIERMLCSVELQF